MATNADLKAANEEFRAAADRLRKVLARPWAETPPRRLGEDFSTFSDVLSTVADAAVSASGMFSQQF
jgi:hypothetical protein